MSETVDEVTRTETDFRTVPPKVTAVVVAWQAWWEDYDSWNGAERYDELDVAKHHAAVDYVDDEYGWNPESGAAEDAPGIELYWEKKYGNRWVLFVNDPDEPLQETNVYIHPVRIFSTQRG